MSRTSNALLRPLGYGIIAVAGAMGVGAIVFGLQVGEYAAVVNVAVLVPAFLLAAGLAMRAQPRNGAVWAFAGAGLFGAASAFGSHLASTRTGLGVAAIEGGVIPGSPADYDTLSALGISVSLWAWIPATFLLATHLLILFPSGRVPSRMWRVAAWTAGGSMLVLSLQGALALAPWVTTPYEAILGPGEGTTMAPPLGFLMLPLMTIALAAVGRVVLRYRKTTGEERLQYRWVTWAVGLYVVVGIFLYSALVGLGTVGGLVSTVLLANIPVSIAVAITKHRLYDIDFVISRTFVYGALAAFIGVVYVSIVVGIGAVIGTGDEPNPALAIAATAAVAVGFQPVRRRLERIASRLVFGRKATPYEVLSEFSQRVAATDESLLDEVARSLVEGTWADRAAISVQVNGELVESAAWPEAGADPGGEVLAVPIVHDGAELGVLTLMPPSGQKLSDEDVRLAGQVASGMGLALKNRLLTERLHNRVQDLRESRRRLVAVQDETRQKLERDLHDGAQQQLVALKVKLGLSRMIAEKEGALRTVELLREMAEEADNTVESLRDFARGVYPPLLEAEGLGAAISGQARRSQLPITVESDGIGRFSKDVEATVYFCVLEALRNVAHHADATQASVTIFQLNGSLEFRVADDGSGFDPDMAQGSGLTTMTDRIDALSGSLVVMSQPRGGTVLIGSIPVAVEVPT